MIHCARVLQTKPFLNSGDKKMLRNLRLGRSFIQFWAAATAVSVTLLTQAIAIEAKLLRHPDISESQVVFSYAEDLWIVSKNGGNAVRLTASPGEETHPKFSPDGRLIAFTAPYAGGNEDIYIVPVSGGVPERVTHHPAFDRLLDWSPDGESLIYATDMTSERKRYNQIYQVSRHGGLPQRLPMPYGEMAALSPSGDAIAYSFLKDFQNQPDFNREAWKRYRGGRAPDLWFYNFVDKESRRLTDHPAPDSAPMWNATGFYFLSERGGRSNLWSLDVNSKNVRQLTDFSADDVTRPSIGPKDIVFEYDGGLQRIDLDTGVVTPIKIEVVVSHLQLAPHQRRVGDDIQSADLFKDGSAAVFSARGDLATIEIGTGVIKKHGASSASAERYPSPSSDGQYLAYMSDRTGEYQLHIRDMRSGDVRIVTEFEAGFRYKPFWSPDGRRIAFIDSTQTLYLVDVRSGRAQKIDKTLWRDHFGLESFSVSWSPDGRWLAWSRGIENRNQAVFIYDVEQRRRHQLTSGYYSDANPVFDDSGNYLFMLSQRALSSVYSDIDFTWAYANSTMITVAPLRASVRSPVDPTAKLLPPQSNVQIDIQDFESRVRPLPIPAGNYSDLSENGGRVVYLKNPNAGGQSKENTVGYYDLSTKRNESIIKGVRALIAVGDGVVLVRSGDDGFAIDLKPNQQLNKPLPTGEISVLYDRRAESEQIVRDAWRFQRDFFYDPGLHNAPWTQIRDKYLKLAQHAVTDSDLSFLLREQVGELSAGHVWAVAKRRERYDFSGVGLLGADFTLENGAYRFSKIFDAGPRRTEHFSPLDTPGAYVSEGEYLLAVNSEPIDMKKDPWAAFEGTAGKNVELSVSPTPRLADARNVVVKTLASDAKLRELAWVEENRQKVEKASGGAIGYIFVPDTGRNGQDELMRQYRAQFNKKGLVIDERFNSGGALGDRLVELLNRPPLVYFSVRNGPDYPLPELSHYGPKAMVTNGWSYSGGDGFPLLFKAAGVGPLIGSRTWGGLIGPATSVPFVSGGRVAAPPQRVYTTDGAWAGPDGVEPDIKVENDPGLMMKGQDPQLERAIQYVLEELENYPAHPKPQYPSQLQ